MNEQLFLDTSFIQAVLNKRDQYRESALRFVPLLQTANELWITEAVLVEVGNAFSRLDRLAATQFIAQCYRQANMRVVGVETKLLSSAVDLYNARSDKTWGLTDCISFVVMEQQGLSAALTADQHFTQAGSRALLLEAQ